jgi:hypothetical protein
VPPLDLERRLEYLIRYPHGCIEQLTSAAFPQLFLPSLLKLEESRKKEIEQNVNAAIERLRGFQQPNGAFAYWPGGFGAANSFDTRDAWSTNYAGHFLVEAGKLGYSVPASMQSDWLRFQKQAAQAWTAGSATPTLDQAYRLYTLALANQPEIGAMNRLRETRNLPRRRAGCSRPRTSSRAWARRPATSSGTTASTTARRRMRLGSRPRFGDRAERHDLLGRMDGARSLVDDLRAFASESGTHPVGGVRLDGDVEIRRRRKGRRLHLRAHAGGPHRARKGRRADRFDGARGLSGAGRAGEAEEHLGPHALRDPAGARRAEGRRGKSLFVGTLDRREL